MVNFQTVIVTIGFSALNSPREESYGKRRARLLEYRFVFGAPALIPVLSYSGNGPFVCQACCAIACSAEVAPIVRHDSLGTAAVEKYAIYFRAKWRPKEI